MNLSTWFNSQVVQSVARWLIDKLGLFLMGAGYLSNEQAATFTGAALTLVMLAFSVISARTKSAALKVVGSGSTADGTAIVKSKIAAEVAAKR